ncbi:MAG: hypothetical protein P8H45_01450 [Flavobacteriaceae bacterium]|nr:hypothetical protein [Flavobacteriaceae bacterium]
MFKQIKLQTLFIASILLAVSCTKDDPEEIHEHEINKVILHFTNTADNSSFKVKWELEHDGEEHTDDDEHAHESHIELAPNSTYSVEAEFYQTNEEEDSHDHDGDHEEEGEDITPEIIDENDVHYIFYEFVGLNNLSITSADDDVIDTNGFGINLNTTWTTTAKEIGDIKLYLIHEPQTKEGSVRNDFGGEDDTVAGFEVHIELED